MNILKSRVTAVVAGASALVILSGGGGAMASRLITSASIKDNSVRSIDLKDGYGVGASDLKPSLRAQVNQRLEQGPRGFQGQDGVSNLIVGSGYTSTWKAGKEGESIETCPTGQSAIGGGYSTFGGFNGTHDSYDLGGSNTDIQVTVSAPYFKGDYKPVDEAGNFRADQWVVRGVNHGSTDQVVRAWVVCADVN